MISNFSQGESIESAWIWRHLVLAGLIEGDFVGSNWSGRSLIQLPRDLPTALGGTAGYLVTYETSFGAHQIRFATVSHTDNQLKGPALRTEEAWNIDTKMDDGMAGSAKVRGANTNNATGGAITPACLNGSLTYDLATTSLACRMGFIF